MASESFPETGLQNLQSEVEQAPLEQSRGLLEIVHGVYDRNRSRVATLATTGLAFLGGSAALSLKPNTADARLTGPRLTDNCVMSGLSRGSARIAFTSQTALEITPEFDSLLGPGSVCGNRYKSEVDVYETVENTDRTGFFRNTPVAVFAGLNSILGQPVVTLNELTNSATCLNDGQGRLRNINYIFKMISTTGGKSYSSHYSEALTSTNFPDIQPGNPCAINTQDVAVQGNAIKASTFVVQEGRTSNKPTKDLPLIHNRKPTVHHPGFNLQLRGPETVKPKKKTGYEIVSQSSTSQSVDIIAVSGRNRSVWAEQLVSNRKNRKFVNMRFPFMTKSQNRLNQPVTIEAINNKHKIIFKETEIISERR